MRRCNRWLAAWLVAVFAAAAVAVAQGDADRFVTKDAQLSGADGGALGTLMLGAQVTLAGDPAGDAHVVVQGWSMADAPSVMFLTTEQRITLASLTAAGQAARTVVSKQTDAYGTDWEQVRVEGTVAPAALSSDRTALWSQAEALYGSTCSACHALHSPGEFTANQWPGSLKAMLPNVSLTDAQIELVTKYLQYNAKDM